MAGMYIACLGIFSLPFGETLHHHDKDVEFWIAFVENDIESQGSFQVALQASLVAFLILHLVIPLNGMIALRGCSQIMSAKNGGVYPPPHPLVSQK